MRGLPHYALPSLEACRDANLQVARLTNPDSAFVGVSINTSAMARDAAADYLKSVEDALQLPAVDAFKDGVAPIVDRLQ